MCDDWLCGLELPMTGEQFRLLPRNPAYAFEYRDGVAHLYPRPRYYHAVLPLEPCPSWEGSDDSATVRPLRHSDWEHLTSVFADAFRDQPPFGHLTEEGRQSAAAKSLAFTRAGGDGLLIARACWLAVDEQDMPRGAILVTLLPDGDPSAVGSYHWAEPAPVDAVERRLGRPHVTWIFARHADKGRGLGTALVRSAVDELRRLGFRELATTFLLGNTSSLLWHWRMGFRLVAYPFSRRQPWPKRKP